MANWGKCDFSQLRDLQKRLEKLQDADINVFYTECAKELTARLLAKVIARTPVGETVSHFENVVDANNNAVSYKKDGKKHKKGDIKQKKATDYMGGTLRRGWTSKSEGEAKSGSVKDATTYANSLKIVKSGDIYNIDVINPVHYASDVEFGHRQTPGRYVPSIGKKLKKSWVTGKFMLTISEQELEAQAPSIVEVKIKKYLEECFNGK